MGNLSVMAENCSALQTGVAPTIEFYLEVITEWNWTFIWEIKNMSYHRAQPPGNNEVNFYLDFSLKDEHDICPTIKFYLEVITESNTELLPVIWFER